MSEYQVAMEAMEKLRSGGFECQGGPLENNMDFKKVGVCLDALQRSREQNDRMRQWFVERTGSHGLLLSEQMKALDERIDELTKRLISLITVADVDEKDKDMMVMKASPDFVEDTRKFVLQSPL